MTKVGTWIKLILVVLLGIFIQVLFILVDSKDTPSKAVVEFTKAYFMLDPAMSERLCSDMATAEGDNVVDHYIQLVTKEARDRGLSINCLKSKLYHIRTYTISKNDTEAQIRITCQRRTSINPFYGLVAKIFNIGEAYPIDEIVKVVKEGDKWKICGKVFSLSP